MNTNSRSRTRGHGILLGFGLVALLLAAGVSYLADSSPDGLEAVTHQGCTTVQTPRGEQLQGQCIARSSTEHAFGDSLFAGYTVGGDASLTGVAGVIGVAATAVVAGGLFWLLRGRGPRSGDGGR